MHWSMTLGTIAETKIRLHFTFLLFLLWVAVSDYDSGGARAAATSAIFLIAAFVCVLAHEFGHILMARKFGIHTPEVILSPIGGIANMERIPDVPIQELLIAAAGPSVNLLIAVALLLFGIHVSFDPATWAVGNFTFPQRLLLINLAMLAFNLVPAFPMDGGRVFRAILAFMLPYGRATLIAVRVGQAFAILFMGYGLLNDPLLAVIGLFLLWAGNAELEIVRARAFAGSMSVQDGMERNVTVLTPEMSIAEAANTGSASAQSVFPVLDQRGTPVGVMTRSALNRILSSCNPSTPVSAVMAAPSLIEGGSALSNLLIDLDPSSLSKIVVDKNGRMIGLVSPEEVLRLMLTNALRQARL